MPSAHTAIRMSLRANRLKYSIAGDNASIVDVKSAPQSPSRDRKSSGMSTSAVPAMAYSRRAV